MSAYRYTEYGSAYPTQASYHDNTGYYGNSQQIPARPASQKGQQGGFEPVRMYPANVQKAPKYQTYNWHMLRAAAVAVCCCPWFGLIGLIYAILSYVDYGKGEMRDYSNRKNCSIGWTVAAIVFGTLGFFGAVGYGIWVAVELSGL